MLALPLASSDMRDHTAPLLSFLQKHRAPGGNGSAEEQDDLVDIKAFESLREVAVQAESNEPEKRLAYHHLLSNLLPRLVGHEKDLQLQVCWSDPFIKSQGKTVSHSLYFDWANVLWNHAASLSLQAALTDLSLSDDNIREACRLYQQASGTFEFIRAQLLPRMDVKMTALSDTGLCMASYMMLAQAQLCFYRKAVKDHKAGSMKPLIVAKLAKQCAEFYSTTALHCRPELLRGDASWYAHCEFESRCFAAAAEYWQAIAAQEASLAVCTGEAIARLTAAEALLQSALALSQQHKLAPSVAATADELLLRVRALRNTAVKDNDMIFFSTVPAAAELQAIVPVAMVKSIPLPEPTGPVPRLFGAVLPAALQRTLALVRERATALAQTAQRDGSQATDQAREMVASVGLPTSLEVYKSADSGAGVPDSLWDKVLTTQQAGGLAMLQQRYPELQASSERCYAAIEAVEEVLQREEQADVEAGTAHLWGGGSGSSSTSGGVSDLVYETRQHKERLREAFFEAQGSDALWAGLLSSPESLELMALLASPRSALVVTPPRLEQPLLDLMNDDVDSVTNERGLQPEVVALEELLVQLVGVIDSRAQSVAAVSALAASDWPAVLSSAAPSSASPEDVVDALLQPAQAHLSALAAALASQQALLPAIMSANAAFVRIRANDAVTILKDGLVRKVEQALATFASAQENLSRALSFYASLQSRLDALQHELQDGAFARVLQREEHAQQQSAQSRLLEQEARDEALARQMSAEAQQQQQQQLMHQQQQQQQLMHQQQQQHHQQAMPPAYHQSMQINGTDVSYGTPVDAPPNTGYPGSSVPSIAGQGYGAPFAAPYGGYGGAAQGQVVHVAPGAGPGPGGYGGAQHPPPQQLQQQQPGLPAYSAQYVLPQLPQQQYHQQQQQYHHHQQQQQQPPPAYQPPPYQPPSYQAQAQASGTHPANYAANYAAGSIAPVPTTAQRLQQMGFTEAERAGLEAKVRRLAEMGFADRDAVVDALLVSGLNEEAAVGRLLGGPTIAPSPAPVHPPPAPPSKPADPGGAGLFGMRWGR